MNRTFAFPHFWRFYLLLGALLLTSLCMQAQQPRDSTACGALLDRLLLLQAYPDSVIDALREDSPCWEVFSQEEQVRAYRLLAEVHLLQIPPNVPAASAAYQRLLALDPEYDLTQQQGSAELLRVALRFDHRPWRIRELLVGGHAPLAIAWGEQSTAQRRGLEGQQDVTRTPLFSFEVGAGTWRNLNAQFTQWPRMRRWEVGLRAAYRVSRYRYEELLSTNLLDRPNEDFARLHFHETQQWATVSLGLRHHFDPRHYAYEKARPLTPYLHAGLEAGWLISARFSQVFRQSEVFAADTLVEIVGRQTGLDDPGAGQLRRNVALWASAGVGLTYKWGTEYLALELGYAWGLTNLVNVDRRYDHPEMVFRYGYVDPDWNLHRLSLSISYWLPSYRTRLKPEFKP